VGLRLNSRPVWVTLYALAMAFVEAAVVVYLRSNISPVTGLPQVPSIEVAREAATIVMLLAVAALSGSDRWERFLWFCVAFGIWDIGYYVWLRLLIGWPASLLSWDVLFLIPVPWMAPVLAPVIVSVGLVTGSLWLLRLHARGAILRFSPWLWALVVGGGALVLLSFMLDYRLASRGLDPPAFRWVLFGSGVGSAALGLVLGVRRSNAS
jgi:hypothetical protein